MKYLITILLLFASVALGQSTTQPADPRTTVQVPITLSQMLTTKWKSGTQYAVTTVGEIAYNGNGFPDIPSDVEIVAPKQVDGSPAATINFHANAAYQHLFNIPDSSNRVAIRNFCLNVNNIEAIQVEGDDVRLENIQVYGGQFLKARNSQRGRAAWCSAPKQVPAYGIYFDWAGMGNGQWTFYQCYFYGSMGAHDVRFYGLHDSTFDTCTFLNPDWLPRPSGYVKGDAVKACEGTNILFRSCTFDGPVQVGPNYQKESQGGKPGLINGKFYPANAPLTPLLTSIKFENCVNKSGVGRLQPGAVNFNWNGGSITTANSSQIFVVTGNTGSAPGAPNGFPDRPVVSGMVSNLKAVAHGLAAPVLFNWRPANMHIGQGVTLNGKPQVPK